MRRRSTILSLPGLVILAVLLAALGLTLWRQGGLAFSPGALSSQSRSKVALAGFNSHAEFEGQCALCHQPLSSMQADLCVECHITLKDQMAMKEGLHGKLDNVRQCADCHSDHRGREFDLRLGQLGDFDHSLVAFSLIWHQVDYSMAAMECLDCHETDDQFSVSTLSCAACHADHDMEFITSHLGEFGDGCTSCHDGLDSLVRFDHATASFPLDGSHQRIPCVDCHLEGQFLGLPGECVACHEEPAVHLGVLGVECAECHNEQSWKPALFIWQPFDHNIDTSFSLVLHAQNYSGEGITCASCHENGLYEFQQTSCSECHSQAAQEFMTQHQAQFGTECLECHDGIDRMRNFDHQDIFPLDGRHSEIDCQACHVEQVYQGTPAECKDCHPEPDIHAGFFGLKCEYCHSTSSWHPAQLVNHQFPIDHGDQGDVECQMCHVSTYNQYSCYECHEHQKEEVVEKHKELDVNADRLAACTECHIDGLVHEHNEADE